MSSLKTYTSTNGFYSLEYPDTFKMSYQDNLLQVYSPDNNSSITISSYHFDDSVDDIRFEQMFQIFSKEYTPVADKFEISSNIWIQRFSKNDDDYIWTLCMNRNDKVLLLISINFLEEESDEIIDAYQEVLHSIKNHCA